ncbi:Lipid kinase [Methylocella tundrae]|uniref:Lipid kinase n=1 Tax=Methylocella tundrae TaxID=227605 RepID=A0A8B6MC20_METTU|nr:putative urea ABC transporter substrate-binding protein [Methylocella tundrae]VTZ27275.1 Lipid kinase [Methylocella tundrae]VTZ52550.1 Lipid kinase [Methylocella tundrae]
MLPTKNLASKIASLGLGAVLLFGAADAVSAAPKKDFKLAWSIYVGWMPWQWANDHGIVKKWADKYGIKIDVVQFNDYAESINQYTAGAFDALTVTNMDTVATPAVGGVDSTAVIVGDFSNGNDAVILKDKSDLKAIKGQKVNLVQFSVSHYLLDRALASIGMTEKDVTVVNTSDADMAAAFATPDVTAVTTWNPIVSEIMQRKDAHEVFDSSKIPGEIMDLAIANTKTLEENPDFGKALAGIWYETLAIMSAKTPAGQAAREDMGKASGTDLAGFESQLKTTRMFYTPADAIAFTTSAALPKTMKLVNEFLFTHGLLGDAAKSADVIGVKFPDGSVLGDPKKIGLRFVTTYMDAAATAKN